jgi:hypothetical protein
MICGIPRTRLLTAVDVGPDLKTEFGRLPWYVRMYGHRAFTPGEFRSAEPSNIVPFPDLKRPWNVPRVSHTSGHGLYIRRKPSVVLSLLWLGEVLGSSACTWANSMYICTYANVHGR